MTDNVFPIFPERETWIGYSADVYFFDKAKYQFDVDARSLNEAFNIILIEAFVHRGEICLIKVYVGSLEQRVNNSKPAMICMYTNQSDAGSPEFLR